MDIMQLDRYDRHIILNEIGLEGQKKILNAKVLVVGAGGLGAPKPYTERQSPSSDIVASVVPAVDLIPRGRAGGLPVINVVTIISKNLAGKGISAAVGC